MGFLGDLMDFSGKRARADAELQLRQDEFKQRTTDRQHAQAVQALEEQRKMRPMLDEAYTRFGGEDGDPKQLSATIEDIFKGYQAATNSVVHPDVIKAFKDPKFGSQLLDSSAQNGTTLGQLFQGGTDASMRAMARLALQKENDSRKSQHAFVAGDSAVPEAPAPTPTGPQLGQGLQLGGAPQPVALPSPAPAPIAAPAQPGASPAPAAVPAVVGAGPTPGTASPIQNPDGTVTTERSITVTDKRLNNGQPTNIPTVWGGKVVPDEQAIANAVQSGRQWQAYPNIPAAVAAAQARSAALGRGEATSIGGASGQGAQPPGAPTPALQAAVDQLDGKIANLQKNIGIVVSKGDKTGPLVTALNERLKVLQDQRFQLTSKYALGQVEAENQTGRQPLPRQELSESGLPLGTRYRDVGPGSANPGATMLTPMQHAAIGATAQSGGTELTDVIHQGGVARQTRPMLDVAVNAGLKVGPTGPIVTPVKEALYNIANVFGIKTEKQTALQVLDAITPRLAVQLTSQMKGSQSDREFLAGVQSAANKNQTNQAFAMVAYFTRELADMAIEKEIQARRWTADASHPGLNIPDKYGKTFQDRYDEIVASDSTRRGSIGERTAAAFKVDYKDVLKGKLSAARAKD